MSLSTLCMVKSLLPLLEALYDRALFAILLHPYLPMLYPSFCAICSFFVTTLITMPYRSLLRVLDADRVSSLLHSSWTEARKIQACKRARLPQLELDVIDLQRMQLGFGNLLLRSHVERFWRRDVTAVPHGENTLS